MKQRNQSEHVPMTIKFDFNVLQSESKNKLLLNLFHRITVIKVTYGIIHQKVPHKFDQKYMMGHVWVILREMKILVLLIVLL